MEKISLDDDFPSLESDLAQCNNLIEAIELNKSALIEAADYINLEINSSTDIGRSVIALTSKIEASATLLYEQKNYFIEKVIKPFQEFPGKDNRNYMYAHIIGGQLNPEKDVTRLGVLKQLSRLAE